MVKERLKVSAKEVFQYLAAIEFTLMSKKEKDDFKDLLLFENIVKRFRILSMCTSRLMSISEVFFSYWA